MALKLKEFLFNLLQGGTSPTDATGIIFKQGDQNLLRGANTITSGTGTWATETFRNSGSGGTIEYAQTITKPTGVSISSSDFPSTGAIITATASNTAIGFCQDGCPSELKQMTMSVWVKGNSGDKVVLQPIWSGTSGQEESGSQTTTLSDSNWHHLTYTKTPNYAHTSVSLGYVYYYAAAVNNKLYVLAPKIEYGGFSTAWSDNARFARTEFTSFAESPMVGSGELTKTTLTEILAEIAYGGGSSDDNYDDTRGKFGSVYLGTAYDSNGDYIPTGWYNYMSMNYGSTPRSIMLFGMTSNRPNRCYDIRYNGSILQIKRILFSSLITKANMSNSTTTYYNLNGTAGTHYYYVKFGNIVTVSFNVKCTSPSSSWASFASGLPTHNSTHISFPLSCAAPGVAPIWCRINTDGTVSAMKGTANNYYYGSFCYLTTDA